MGFGCDHHHPRQSVAAFEASGRPQAGHQRRRRDDVDLLHFVEAVTGGPRPLGDHACVLDQPSEAKVVRRESVDRSANAGQLRKVDGREDHRGVRAKLGETSGLTTGHHDSSPAGCRLLGDRPAPDPWCPR